MKKIHNNCLNCKNMKKLHYAGRVFVNCEIKDSVKITKDCDDFTEGENLVLIDQDMNEYIGALTKEMDDYLKRNTFDMHTYAYFHDSDIDLIERGIKDKIALRYPGATIGHIKVTKDLIIEEIVLYNDNFFKPYNPEVVEVFDKYINKKIVFQKI